MVVVFTGQEIDLPNEMWEIDADIMNSMTLFFDQAARKDRPTDKRNTILNGG